MHWLLDAYQHHIVRSGRELIFMVLVGVGGFVPVHPLEHPHDPGAESSGGPERDARRRAHTSRGRSGLVFLLIGGIGNFAIRGDGRPYRELLALLFGIGVGLVLDEFALILHLEDVYWAEEGRRSLDAVLLVGAAHRAAVDRRGPTRRPKSGRHTLDACIASWTITLFLVVITLLKGKVWTALLGIMIPLFVLVRRHPPRSAAERLVALAI